MRALQANLSRRSRAVSAKRLFGLERKGKYEEALREISDNSLIPGFAPDISELTDSEAAELRLRFAALLGFYGHNRQITDSQQRSKDILTDVRDRFESFGEVQKVVECENYIALCYWRTGELNEAEVWIESALARSSEITDARMYAFVTRSLILLSKRRYEDNISECVQLSPMFFRFGDAFLTGSYCTNVGLSFKNAGRRDEALRYLQLARGYHGIAKHHVYLGTAENNLAQLYKTAGHLFKAHESIDAAIRSFRHVKDHTREGFALDTKALIYYSEGKFDLALKAVESAVRILRKGENAGYLAETLQTKCKIQVFLEDVSGAVETLHEAMDIARVQVGEECAAGIFNEFLAAANELADTKTDRRRQNVTVTDKLQLVLPDSLSHYDDYQGLWIKNPHLESLGLTVGSLAVIAPARIKRGDLVAVSEVATDAVSCGFYDEEFGIICLEGVNTDPQLFDADAVRVLGKIIGVCGGKDENGKMAVEPLNI